MTRRCRGPLVSNAVEGEGGAGETDLQLLNLKSNFIWHMDSTFLPTPAISNILLGETIPSAGGDTEFVSTRIGWARMAEALFNAAYAYGVRGLPAQEGADLIAELMAAVTSPDAIYAHHWRRGDVLIWDQRATLHRGTPWPYEEERSLASFVSSARESDGIASARP